jgi:osmotically-inducible protein OsmY
MKRLCMRIATAVLAVGLAMSQSNADDRIYDEVRLKLAGDAAVNGGAIEVEVKAGAVVLKGRVRNEKARVKAEKLAAKVKGVKSVSNQLRVDPNAH